MSREEPQPLTSRYKSQVLRFARAPSNAPLLYPVITSQEQPSVSLMHIPIRTFTKKRIVRSRRVARTPKRPAMPFVQEIIFPKGDGGVVSVQLR